jgi:malate dehydrogenase
VLQPSQIQRAIHRTRQAGTTIVGKLKTCGSFYAASWVVAEIAASILHDRRRVFPVNCHCRGEYELRGVSPALPCVIGAAGVERILELPLDEFEQAAVICCAEGIREGCLNISPSVP